MPDVGISLAAQYPRIYLIVVGTAKGIGTQEAGTNEGCGKCYAAGSRPGRTCPFTPMPWVHTPEEVR